MRTNWVRNARAVAIGLLLIAVCWYANALFDHLPVAGRTFDVSPQGLTKLSDETAAVLKNLDRDVTIGVVASGGISDPWLGPLLSRYEQSSPRIRVERLSPDADKVLAYDPGGLADGSLIVESELRGMAIGYSSLYAVQTYYDYYGNTGQQVTGFAAERQVTGAIEYAVRTDLPVAYQLAGHGETALTGGMAAAFGEANVDLKPLNLAEAGAMPEDAALLIVGAPQTDLNGGEADAVLDYLARGGSVLLSTDARVGELPHLAAVTARYGMAMQKGLVLEGSTANMLYDSNAGQSYPQYIMPNATPGEQALQAAIGQAGGAAVLPLPHPIVGSGTVRDALTVTNLLESTGQSYLKANIDAIATTDREDGDAVGPFAVAAVAEEAVPGGTATLIWVGSAQFMTDAADSWAGGGNAAIVRSILTALTGERENAQVAERSLLTGGLSFSGPPVIAIAVVVAMPLLALIGWAIAAAARRRRRRV